MKRIPAWVMRKAELRMLSNRPSVAYLPPQEDKGSVRPFFQPSLSAITPVEEEKTRVERSSEEVVVDLEAKVEGSTKAVRLNWEKEE